MAAQVPPADRLSAPPPWALAHVPGLEQGHAPLRVARLAGGSVNEVFRVDSAVGRFALRLDGPDWRRPGVDRQRELRLQRAAAAAGITPSLIYADASREGLLISVYESGRLWTGADYEDVQALRRLGERLYVLHRLPAPALALFDPWQVAQEYVRVIQSARSPVVSAQSLRESLDRLQAECARLNETSLGACIVHGDLTEANLLEGSRLDAQRARGLSRLQRLVDDADPNPAAREPQRQDKAGRSGPHDQDFAFGHRHTARQSMH